MIRVPTFSAPGKMVIAGEYAVVEGFEALAFSIDRRAKVRLSSKCPSSSAKSNRLLVCIFEEFASHGHEVGSLHVEIDTSELHTISKLSNLKLGAGSSSAIAVALSAALLDHLGLDSTLCFELAFAAHKRFTNQNGSGIDVATSYYGGAIRYQLTEEGPRAAPMTVLFDTKQIIAVHTGVAQSTNPLLAKMCEVKDTSAYHEAIAGIGYAAQKMISEMTSSAHNFNALCADVAEHNYWMNSLGTLTGTPLLCPEHRLIQKIAEHHGGTAKPSGAGGGDISLSFVPIEAQDSFEKDLLNNDLLPLSVNFCARGLESH
jgi:phosphomevalonate kinase